MMHDPVVAGLGDFDAFVSAVHLQPAYQPIVDLATGEVVAFEALARWPDLPGAAPDAVFAAARLNGRTAELDWACRLAALRGALDFGLGRDVVLFVNVEPETLGTRIPHRADAVVHAARHGLRVMLELTERSLVRRPADLLRLVEWARSNEWGIALDDVGADPASLALLPFLAPDVVKLDMTLVRQRPSPDQAAIMAAVMAHSERTGALVLAEGIESDAHLDQALALGATLAQGWSLGRPGALFRTAPPASRIETARPAPPVPATPFTVVEGHDQLRIGRKGLLLDLSLHIESQGRHLHPAPVVLSAFQTADRFTRATATRYEQLGARCPLVVALGVGLDSVPAAGVHGVALDPADPLAREWTVTTVGPHYAAALVARDLGDDGPDHERRFEFVVTHDRDLVLAASRSLMSRVTSTRPPA
ncbi:MAG: hypothetical protein JWN99_1951 [Ilumatobacteraceae bacterium]|nr:hypothetical protein [Ilumatobacteraceae bacterium]